MKLAALGDVLRTTPLLRTLRTHLGDCQITWVTESQALPLLKGARDLDRAIAFEDPALPFIVASESFDIAICLDKEPRACALLATVQSTDKRGFVLASNGSVMPATDSAQHFWRLGLDDRLKFVENDRSYPDLMHEAIDVPYHGEGYVLEIAERDRHAAREHLKGLGLEPGRDVLVGFQTGAGGVFANKAWTLTGMAAAIRATVAQLGARPVLLGGPREAELNEAVAGTAGVEVVDSGTGHDLVTFSAIIDAMDVVVAGDTLAMHLAIARGCFVVALFGPTCSQEIDLFGRGEKVVTGLDCSPCYRRECDLSPSCMDEISAQNVVAAFAGEVDRVRRERSRQQAAQEPDPPS